MLKKRFFRLLGIALILLTACKKEGNDVGGSLQQYNAVYTDTLSDIQVFAIAEDSIRTSKMSAEIFGWVDDPVFGTVRADLLIQFRLSANAVDFGAGAALDSVVLSLPYAGYFGDTANRLTVGVYELDESMHKDSLYYSTTQLAVQQQNLAENTPCLLEVRPMTAVVVTGESQNPQLRIPLQKSYFTQKVMDKSGSKELSDNAHFLQYFKGLMLKVEQKENGGCLAYLDVLNTLTTVTFHYHNNDHDSLTFQLVSNDSSVYYARISHQGYADAEADLRKQVVDKNYTDAETSVYVQASGGIKTQLRFPTLKSRFGGRRVAVHKAELLLSPEDVPGGYQPYFRPSSLSMYYKQDSLSSKSYFLPDYLHLGTEYFGGGYRAEDSLYRFLLTEYVQYVLMDKLEVSYPIYLIVNGAATQATRVKLKGPAHADRQRRMRLIVTYSYIN